MVFEFHKRTSEIGSFEMNANKKGGMTGTHLDFAMCTIECRDVGSTPGNVLMTRVRTVSSIADTGNEDRNNDIWVQMSH
jgi:hypothetical protein